MIWKAIGASVTGTSHTAAGKGCEDAIEYRTVSVPGAGEALICCASDGAGSAQFAALASAMTTSEIVRRLAALIPGKSQIIESDIYSVIEDTYECLKAEAERLNVPINEFSCTLLGCCLTGTQSVFFQIGDGAIVYNDGLDFYTVAWWPQNGEYQNSTVFLVDDPALKNLRIKVVDTCVEEAALFTDGLQMLALNMDAGTVHQPFFNDLFRVVRMAENEDEVAILQGKLCDFLESSQVSFRTDDDKTLFLASRMSA